MLALGMLRIRADVRWSPLLTIKLTMEHARKVAKPLRTINISKDVLVDLFEEAKDKHRNNGFIRQIDVHNNHMGGQTIAVETAYGILEGFIAPNIKEYLEVT